MEGQELPRNDPSSLFHHSLYVFLDIWLRFHDVLDLADEHEFSDYRRIRSDPRKVLPAQCFAAFSANQKAQHQSFEL